EREPALRLVLGVEEADAEAELRVELLDDLLVAGALVDGDAPALQVLDLANARTLLHQDAVAGDEGRRQEIDLTLTREVVGGGRADHVDGAVEQQRNARRRDERLEFHLELFELQLGLHAVDDLEAEIDRVALRLAVLADEGERRRILVVADGD